MRLALAVAICSLCTLAFAGDVVMEKAAYGGWPNCVRVSNGEVELIATTDVGPRIIRFGFIGGQNLFKEFPAMMGRTGASEWLVFGGHRLWHAPEQMPRTYAPDNDPVQWEWTGKTLKLMPPVEKENGIRKEMEVTMAPSGEVRVLHRVTNVNRWQIELAPWALSVMAPGGRAILPQENYIPHEQYLLPARPLVLWHYSNMADPRWTWGQRFIQLRQDPSATTKQKVGVLNKQGWAAYCLNGQLFVKRYASVQDAQYPDFGSNTELYTDPEMLEVETLGPLTRLAPSASVEHEERWSLHKVNLGESEEQLAKTIDALGLGK